MGRIADKIYCVKSAKVKVFSVSAPPRAGRRAGKLLREFAYEPSSLRSKADVSPARSRKDSFPTRLPARGGAHANSVLRLALVTWVLSD